ncbi:thiamine phosphate synthase [Naumannella cuiyingiana]|uniref:Thiamine-phosphate synthase n=1 Tax=Naumannella cuiyingiana TaxID=1347891 RepID=A0A7Z0DB45_9ACTN|nr:thiamine-phosphate pyrophosphorylase [Naumannella cuiyingiana]
MTFLLGLDTRLRQSRLYLCVDTRRERGDFDDLVAAAFAGGVDIVQVREKNLPAEVELEYLERARAAAGTQHLVAVNDQPELAGRFGADVLHLGQDDALSAEARKQVSKWALLGRSTHDPAQADAALADPELAYFCVGPVFATPTKPDYTPAGLDLVRYAARVAPPGDVEARPWFAIGGINAETLDEVIEAGARRVVVVRAITDARDPEAAARALKDRINRAWAEDPATRDYALRAFGPSQRASLRDDPR